VLALVNAALTPAAADALAREQSWQLRRVDLVADAVAAMTPAERASVRVLIVEAEPVGAALLRQLSGLHLIACLRGDPVNVDVAAATGCGALVVHAPGRNAEAVADFTLGLCLAAARSIAITHHGIVSGALTSSEPGAGPDEPGAAGDLRAAGTAPGDVIWRPADPAAPIPYQVYKGRELSTLTVGVVGFGTIGQAVARRFAGLVHEVHVADPAVPAERIKDRGLIPTDLPDLLPIADVISLHARSAAVVIGRRELAVMKPGAILINTARATVLDYDALREALDSGHLGAAALDVFPQEPIPSGSPLLTQRNLTMTPHLAGATAQVRDWQSEILLAAIRGIYTAGRDWDDLPVRNPELQAAWAERNAAPGPGRKETP
jgi:D-3-phosphoglycerate dehydrogenase / 2-oxoglutarate reductase